MIRDRQGSVAERVYRLLLLAYPPAFRERYGQEMMETFRQCQRESCQAEGLKGPARFWLLILSDWVRSSWFRFYLSGAAVLALVVFWMVFVGGGLSPLRYRSPTIAQLASVEPRQMHVIAPEGPFASRVGKYGLHYLHLNAGSQRSLRQVHLFRLAGPATVADEIGSPESGAKFFKLIGDPSIKRAEFVELPRQIPE